MFDVIVIGGGVTGCSILRELSKYDLKVALLEKEEDVCSGTSKANSAIVHAGHDAKSGSLKAKLNVRGNELIKELAKEKMTMVIVTHEMAFARDVANHVIFMDDGYIVEEGTPEEVFGQTQNERTKQFLQRFNDR